jgi:hypothetical protein
VERIDLALARDQFAIPIISPAPWVMGIARNERHGRNRNIGAALHPSYALVLTIN